MPDKKLLPPQQDSVINEDKEGERIDNCLAIKEYEFKTPCTYQHNQPSLIITDSIDD
jgi:hypothetical protein